MNISDEKVWKRLLEEDSKLKELAQYLFCADFDGKKIRSAIEGRIAAARAAGISINDL